MTKVANLGSVVALGGAHPPPQPAELALGRPVASPPHAEHARWACSQHRPTAHPPPAAARQDATGAVDGDGDGVRVLRAIEGESDNRPFAQGRPKPLGPAEGRGHLPRLQDRDVLDPYGSTSHVGDLHVGPDGHLARLSVEWTSWNAFTCNHGRSPNRICSTTLARRPARPPVRTLINTVVASAATIRRKASPKVDVMVRICPTDTRT